MYFAHYQKETGIILGYFNSNNPHIKIPEDVIMIGDEMHALAFQEGKWARVIDGIFVVEDIPEPTLEELQKQWRQSLKTKYDNERVRLGSLILMADSEEEEKLLKEEKVKLRKDYDADLDKIEQGINPF